MTTAQRVGIGALAACALVWAGLRAQDRPPRLTKGRVLILQNQRALEGEIELTGDQYHIRQKGGESWVPADSALCLCASWDDAFARLSRQANLRDPDERVRLARWCEYNGLLALAAKEAAAAVQLRPDHPAARRLLARLEKAATAEAAGPPEPPEAPEAAVPAVDLSAESLALFSNRVQPMLMNACASCHATGRGGKFKLTRCYDATLNRRALHQNLAAVLAYVDLDEPAVSPLLYKAVSGHGGATRAPLGGRQSVPFQTLQGWVEMVISNNPHLRKVLGHAKKTQAGPAFGSSKAPAPARAADADTSPEPRPPARELPAVPVSAPQTPAQVPAPAMPAPGSVGLPASQTPAPVATVGQAPAAPVPPAPQAGPSAVTTQTAPRDPFDKWIFNTILRGQP
jgi:hypothetical protein